MHARKRHAELWRIVLLPTIALSLSSAEHFGLIDSFLGLHDVEAVAERFENSYDATVDRQVGPDEVAFKPLLRLMSANVSSAMRTSSPLRSCHPSGMPFSGRDPVG